MHTLQQDTTQAHTTNTQPKHTLPSTHSRHTPMWRVKQKIKAKTDRGKVLIGVWSCLNYENIMMNNLNFLLVQKNLYIMKNSDRCTLYSKFRAEVVNIFNILVGWILTQSRVQDFFLTRSRFNFRRGWWRLWRCRKF